LLEISIYHARFGKLEHGRSKYVPDPKTSDIIFEKEGLCARDRRPKVHVSTPLMKTCTIYEKKKKNTKEDFASYFFSDIQLQVSEYRIYDIQLIKNDRKQDGKG